MFIYCDCSWRSFGCNRSRYDLQMSLPRDVNMHTRNISTTAAPAAMPSLGVKARLVKIFSMMALLARNIVIITLVTRHRLAHSGCGEVRMNCWSFRHRRRQVEKKGSKHPLNTWATRITPVRSTEKQMSFLRGHVIYKQSLMLCGLGYQICIKDSSHISWSFL